MRPKFEDLKKQLTDIPENVMADFITGLSNRYFRYFKKSQYLEQLTRMAVLTPQNPVEIIIENSEGRHVQCTIVGYEYDGIFSLITGTLSANGLNIVSGEVFTFGKQQQAPRAIKNKSDWVSLRGYRSVSADKKKRYIIDHFVGVLAEHQNLDKFTQEVQVTLKRIFLLLNSAEPCAREQVSNIVNNQVVTALKIAKKNSPPVLYPIKLQVKKTKQGYSRLIIESQDTPFFLYSLSTALANLHISIELVHISTQKSCIKDELDVLDENGKPIVDEERINQLKFSILLVKQMTHYLDRSPNPYDTLTRFSELVQNVLKLPMRGQWLSLLSNPLALKELAQLFGTSDFFWEEIIHLQYESLLPIFKHHLIGQPLSQEKRFQAKWQEVQGTVADHEDCIKKLNEFKNQEVFLTELNYIFGHSNFRQFSEQLTELGEVIIAAALATSYQGLVVDYGEPKTIAGLTAKYAVFGLGKLGGKALGYASDMELLLIYSDMGFTDGKARITNADFFERLVKRLRAAIQARRHEIFSIDLRLRPYGKDGPLAISLESFCQYYGNKGHAKFYEKLALVRLRYVSGDPKLGERIEQLRDALIYDSCVIVPEEIWSLRKKQYAEKERIDKANAKFSPGALVDIEYAVQVLQLVHGHRYEQLRTPRIHVALSQLVEVAIITKEEGFKINEAYNFFRMLINGLRMLRSNAEDVYLPELASEEYDHLARRVGYVGDESLSAAQQLHLEFETQTAMVRHFIEKHFSREALASERAGNIADLILNEVPDALQQQVLSGLGFSHIKRSMQNFKTIAKSVQNPLVFARMAILIAEILSQKSDPDRALNNLERFIVAHPNPGSLLSWQPAHIEVLLDIFSVSQFLSDMLVTDPSLAEWVTRIKPQSLQVEHMRIIDELEQINKIKSTTAWLETLRKFKRREILRIAIWDISLKASLQHITREISGLAQAILQAVTSHVWQPLNQKYTPNLLASLAPKWVLLAFGKLGADELNYSSDIDVLMIYDEQDLEKEGVSQESAEAVYQELIAHMIKSLSAYSVDGEVYRVDMNLRPYGKVGQQVVSRRQLLHYYEKKAAFWELQALIKANPVAGNWWLGFEIIESLRPYVLANAAHHNPQQEIGRMRKKTIQQLKSQTIKSIDIKNGPGGIRDIEFLVQGLQLVHSQQHPELITIRDTVTALKWLNQKGILADAHAKQLKDQYVFFRRLEHFLQIMEDRQTHALPKDRNELHALAKRLLGQTATAEQLLQKIESDRASILSAFESWCNLG